MIQLKPIYFEVCSSNTDGMKKRLFISIVLLLSLSGFTQIGINTTTPNAMLDVSSATNGFLIPRIALTADNVAAPVVNPQGGALPVSTLIYNTAIVAGVNGVAPGYYYWNGSLWIPFSSSTSNDWKLDGNTSTTNPTNPLTYGTSTILAAENFIGTTDASDVVIGTNTIERVRIKKASGNIGIGIASPSNRLHVVTNIAGTAATFSENLVVGNSNGIGIEGRSTNNPAFGIGGKFTGNAYGIQAINFGSAGATTFGGEFVSTGPSSTGNRYGINAAANGGDINTGGALLANGTLSTENFGGFFTALNGPKNVGSQSQGNGPANSLNGGVFATAGGGNNSTNYGGNFNAQTVTAVGTTNYGGFFAASGGNKNYGIVVPSGGGTVGFGTITPNAMLDISSTTNGVLLPRIALTASNVAAPVVNPQGGVLPVATLIYNTATIAGINGVSPGYYYWNGTVWSPFSSSNSNDWKLNGNITINDPAIPVTYGTSAIVATENFVGTTDANDVVIGTNNLERLRVKQTTGNVGIGTANPSNTFHVVGTQTGVPTSLFQNTSIGNFNGTGVFGVSVNNSGYGTGGAFVGGLEGVTGQVNLSTYAGTTIGVRGRSTGDGGVGATRVGGDFFGQGVNFENYGGKFLATGGTTNYGGNFEASGPGTTTNYGGNFLAIGGSVGNWAGVFNSTGGQTSTGADFFANNGTIQTTAGYFQAFGTSTNYGTRAIVSSGAINYGGSFVTNGIGTSTNYSGYFISNGGTNNYAGYFSANGGTNNYAIVVPNGSGNVGIGTIAPSVKLDIFSPGNTIGLRILSGNNAEYSSLSLGRTTEYAQIGATTAGTFFTDALNGDMAIKNFNTGKILLGASFIAPSTMAINPNGLVGIGTSIQTRAKLQTQGAVGNTVATFNLNANSAGLALVSDYPGVYFNSYFDTGFRQMSATNYPAYLSFDPAIGQFEFGMNNTTNSFAGNLVANPFQTRFSIHRNNGATVSYNSANVTGLTVSSGGLLPDLGSTLVGATTVTVNTGIGVSAAGENVGVEGRANHNNTSTTDKLGGIFYVTGFNGGPTWSVRSIAAVGSTIDNTVYKILGTGVVSTLVKDTNNQERIMVAPEAPQALFQDIGRGKLVNGFAKINLDPILSKNIRVDETHPLNVFIQLEGECNGVYVANKTAISFEVKELNNGVSEVNFTYQIMASRADEERGGLVSKYSEMRFKPLGREFKEVILNRETETNLSDKMTPNNQ